VRNLQRKVPVNVGQLQSFAERALRSCSKRAIQQHQEIVVLLISDKRIAKLHHRFMNETGPTDVITFQHGEIFISVPTAKRQAREFGTSTLAEIELYIVHGLLHLSGFDDRTPAATRQMRAAEARVLRAAAV
jgi:probable rRNA maturation factor